MKAKIIFSDTNGKEFPCHPEITFTTVDDLERVFNKKVKAYKSKCREYFCNYEVMAEAVAYYNVIARAIF